MAVVDPTATPPPTWTIQYWSGSAWVTWPNVSLDHVLMELNGASSTATGQEEFVFNVPNTAVNRAIIANNVYVQILYQAPGAPNSYQIFVGLCTGAQYTSANLQCIAYNPTFVALQQGSNVNLNFSGTGGDAPQPVNQILASIAALAQGYTVDSFGTPNIQVNCSTSFVAIKFTNVSPWTAALALADALGLNLWCTGNPVGGGGTVYIGTRPQSAVTLTQFETGTKRGIDRSKTIGTVIIQSSSLDSSGNPLQGQAGSGGALRVFLDTHLGTVAELNQLAQQKLIQLNNPNSGTPLVVLTNVAYNIVPGMNVTVSRPDLNLVGTFTVQRVTIGPVLTTLDIDVLVPAEDAALQDITDQITTLNTLQ